MPREPGERQNYGRRTSRCAGCPTTCSTTSPNWSAGWPGWTRYPDTWHGRAVTTDADFARFTEVDLDEATSRLTRLGACYRARLRDLDPATLDAVPADGAWTLRQVVEHVTEVTYYARAMS